MEEDKEFEFQKKAMHKEFDLRARSIALGEARAFHENEDTEGTTEAVVATANAFYNFPVGGSND